VSIALFSNFDALVQTSGPLTGRLFRVARPAKGLPVLRIMERATVATLHDVIGEQGDAASTALAAAVRSLAAPARAIEHQLAPELVRRGLELLIDLLGPGNDRPELGGLQLRLQRAQPRGQAAHQAALRAAIRSSTSFMIAAQRGVGT
jgi:hypothetical protein